MLLVQIIIFMLIVFGGLLFALRQVLTKNISTATSHLDELNAEFIKREEEIGRREAETQKAHDEMLIKAKDEVDRLRQDADKKIQEERDRILEETRVQSEQIIQKAEKTKEMIVNELRQEMETKTAERMRLLVKEVFPPHLLEQIHKLWVADLISAGLSQLSHVRIPEDVTEVRLVSAFPLTSQEKSGLSKKFREQLGRDFSFRETEDPSLIAGVQMILGSLVLDGSVISRIDQALGAHV